MTPQEEQEKLFRMVRKRFHDWHIKQVSGYVHGVVDAVRRKEPRRVYVRKIQKNSSYARGYIYGFIDAYGVDIVTTDWYQLILHLLPNRAPFYRWWQSA